MGFLFDLDGLLINSEELYYEANKSFFGQHGIQITIPKYLGALGKPYEAWAARQGLDGWSGEEIMVATNHEFCRLAETRLGLMPGAQNVLEWCSKRGGVGLVTSSRMDLVDFVFAKTGIGGFFSTLVTGEAIAHGKPNPEGYLLGAQRLGEEARRCVAFEDAPAGVLAAKAAGMAVIAVPNQFAKGDCGFNRADLMCAELGDCLGWLT